MRIFVEVAPTVPRVLILKMEARLDRVPQRKTHHENDPNQPERIAFECHGITPFCDQQN
jgi:hypothetical protein